MNGMRKLLFILMVLPFTLNVRAEDPPSMLEKAVSNIKRWEGLSLIHISEPTRP